MLSYAHKRRKAQQAFTAWDGAFWAVRLVELILHVNYVINSTQHLFDLYFYLVVLHDVFIYRVHMANLVDYLDT